MGLTLAVLAVLLALSVLLYCRKKFSAAKGEATGNNSRNFLVLTGSFNRFSFSSLSSEPPADPEYASISQVRSGQFCSHGALHVLVDLTRINLLLQANGVYENIGLDRQSRSPPADVSSMYTSVRRPNGTAVKDEVCSRQLFQDMIFVVFSVSDCLFSDLKLTLSRWTLGTKFTDIRNSTGCSVCL